MNTQKRTTILGLRLHQPVPRMWRVEGSEDFFMNFDPVWLGNTGARYQINRWSVPGQDGTAQSLRAAVRRYLQTEVGKTAMSQQHQSSLARRVYNH
jgi:hypothetical protein